MAFHTHAHTNVHTRTHTHTRMHTHTHVRTFIHTYTPSPLARFFSHARRALLYARNYLHDDAQNIAILSQLMAVLLAQNDFASILAHAPRLRALLAAQKAVRAESPRGWREVGGGSWEADVMDGKLRYLLVWVSRGDWW